MPAIFEFNFQGSTYIKNPIKAVAQSWLNRKNPVGFKRSRIEPIKTCMKHILQTYKIQTNLTLLNISERAKKMVFEHINDRLKQALLWRWEGNEEP